MSKCLWEEAEGKKTQNTRERNRSQGFILIVWKSGDEKSSQNSYNKKVGGEQGTNKQLVGNDKPEQQIDKARGAETMATHSRNKMIINVRF